MICHHEKWLFADGVLNHKWMFIKKLNKIYKDNIQVLYNNILKYSKLDKFWQLILFFLVKNLPEKDIVHYHKYFEYFDSKNLGEIRKTSFS